MKLMYYYLSFHYKGDYYGLFSTFIQMLHAKKLSQNTIRVYVSYIKPYLTYLEKLQLSPDQASYQTIYLRFSHEYFLLLFIFWR